MRKIAIALFLLVMCCGYSAFAQPSPGFLTFFGNHWRYSRDDKGGQIYVMTNESKGNKIVVYARDPRGKLRALPGATVSTGGRGGGDNAPNDPLGSQKSLVHDNARNMLFAVNAGDNTVSVLDTSGASGRPRLTNRVPSGGYIPVSLAVSDDLLYVLNAGGAGSVATFSIGAQGRLTLRGVIELGLSNATSIPFEQIMAPGQVGVDALARRLMVIHARGQEVLTASLDDQGVPFGPFTSTHTPGIVPFAFDVTRYGTVVVAEAGSGSVTSFDPPADGPLTVKSGAVTSGQGATCWILAHDDGYVYTANTASNSISLYRVSRTGGLTLIDGAAGTTGNAPADITFANGQGFLYSLNPLSGDISGFAIDREDGHLIPVETQGGLPVAAGIQGIAARDF